MTCRLVDKIILLWNTRENHPIFYSSGVEYYNLLLEVTRKSTGKQCSIGVAQRVTIQIVEYSNRRKNQSYSKRRKNSIAAIISRI